MGRKESKQTNKQKPVTPQYTMDRPDLTVANFMENSIGLIFR